VANYRQKTVGALGLESHNFFDPENKVALELREEAAKSAMHDIIKYI